MFLTLLMFPERTWCAIMVRIRKNWSDIVPLPCFYFQRLTHLPRQLARVVLPRSALTCFLTWLYHCCPIPCSPSAVVYPVEFSRIYRTLVIDTLWLIFVHLVLIPSIEAMTLLVLAMQKTPISHHVTHCRASGTESLGL